MTTSKQKRMYRQGDLLFTEVEKMPLDAVETSKVLALGETTGHKHVATGQLQVFKEPKGPVFLLGKGVIVHDEHKPIELPEGLWQMTRQREYVPGTRIRQRTVAD